MVEVQGKFIDLLIYRIDDYLFGIDLRFVDRVIEVVAITPLVDSPDYIMGVISMEGMALPVIDLRKKFGLRKSSLELSHHFIISKSGRHHLALHVDKATAIERLEVTDKPTDDYLLHKMQCLAGVALMHKNIVAIYDLDAFIHPQDKEKLNRALEKFVE